MNSRKLSSKKIRTVMLGAGLLYTLVFMNFIVTGYLNYQKSSAELRKHKAQLIRLEKDVAELNVLIERYQQERKRFETLLFRDQDIPTFLEEVSGFARKSNVDVMNLMTKEFTRVKSYQEVDKSLSIMEKAKLDARQKDAPEQPEGPILVYLPIQISIQGDFSSIVNFLFYLEKYRQLVTLSDVEIKIRKHPLLESDFVINIYSLKDMQGLINK